MSPTREHIDTGVWTARAKARVIVCVLGTVLVAASASAVWASDGQSLVRDCMMEAVELIPGFGAARATRCYFPIERGYAWIDHGTIRCALNNADGDDAISNAWDQAKTIGSHGYDLDFGARTMRRGIWGITESTQRAWIRVSDYLLPYPHIPDSSLARDIRSVMADRMRQGSRYDVEVEFPGITAAGVWKSSTTLWFGCLINACTVLGLVMFACTIRETVRDVQRHQRALILLRDHRCPSCGYDIRGLRSDTATCPECGKAILGPRIRNPSPGEAPPSPARGEGAEGVAE